MLKEAVLTFVIFIILIISFRILNKRNPAISTIVLSIGLSITIIVNIIFLFHNYFPTFVLDKTTPLGDISDNHLLYKSDSEYNCEILFDVLPTRHIILDNGSMFYADFFKTYAKSTQFTSITPGIKSYISSEFVFDFVSDLHIVYMLDYVFSNNDNLDGELTPHLYMCINELSNQDTLIAFSDIHQNLFLLTESQYNSIYTLVQKQ